MGMEHEEPAAPVAPLPFLDRVATLDMRATFPPARGGATLRWVCSPSTSARLRPARTDAPLHTTMRDDFFRGKATRQSRRYLSFFGTYPFHTHSMACGRNCCWALPTL